MITVHLYTGQSLTFPDGTPESVIREASRKATENRPRPGSFDLSHLRGDSAEQPNEPPQRDPRDIKIQLAGSQKPKPVATEPEPLDISARSPEWWKSVTGSSDPAEWKRFARTKQVRQAESSDDAVSAMEDIGFFDRVTYWENPDTGEKFGKKRKVGTLPSRPPDTEPDLWELEGHGIARTSGSEEKVAKEFVRGLPGRIAESEAGLMLPLQAVHAVGRGFKEEIKAIPRMGMEPQSTGEGFRRGATEAWKESPLTQGAARIHREMVEPDRERLIQAAIDAGLSPKVAAYLESAQILSAEAANPGNWMGLEVLKSATSPAGSIAARTAALESRGGARELLDEAGVAVHEYGRGAAPSELAQSKIARSGEFLPGAKEPLFYYDTDNPSSGFKGKIPDTVKSVLDEPWRKYGQSWNLDEPTSVAPKPRQVARDPLPVRLTGGTSTEREHAIGLWDYVSRRYPTISSTVEEVQILPGSRRDVSAFFDRESKVLGIPADADLGLVMHEITHAAQTARGKPVGVVSREPFAVRAGDTYSRIPQPLPREEIPVGGGMSVPGGFASGTAERDLFNVRVAGRKTMDDAERAFSDPDFVAKEQQQIPMPMMGVGESKPMPRSLGMSEMLGPVGRNTSRFDQDVRLGMRVADPAEARDLANLSLGIGDQYDLAPATRGGDIPLPRLPEEIAAERMGWKLPSGSPRITQPVDPIRTPHGQTNIAAQLGGPDAGYFGDPEVAGFVIENSEEVFRRKGPPQTWDTLEFMASRNGRTLESFLEEPSHWSVMPPEERLRMEYVIGGIEDEIASGQAKVVAGLATEADKVELLRLVDVWGDLTRLGVKTGSAYARAMNSMKMEARRRLGKDQLLRQKLYKQYQQQLDREKPLMDSLARLDPNKPEELQAFLRAVNRPSFREYVQEFWISSILSGPATHERNLIGNAVNAVMENMVVRPTAAAMDAARVAGTDAERAVFFRETAPAIVGLTRGIRQGARRGLKILKHGYDPDSMKGKLFPVRSAFARSQNRVVREVVGPVVTMPLRMLSAADAVFKTMNYTAEIYAQAARIAAKEGLSGQGFAARVAHLVHNPTDEMMEAADKFALKATFNDEVSAFGSAIMNLRDLPNAAPKGKLGQAGLETYRTFAGFVIPFVKIADRLMVRGLEYSPAGFLKSLGPRAAGNFAEAADLAARSAIGSVVMTYAASLAMEGRLTASAPTDERERAAFYAAKKQPWSARTDDGTWVPYLGLQPIGTPLALVASMWKGWIEHQDVPDLEAIGRAASEVGVFATDQSYMDGLANFMDSITGPDWQRGQAFSTMATNTVGGFIPYSGLVRSVAKAIDPRVIETDTIGERIKQNIPGLSLGMQAKLTPWGEEVVPVGGRKRAFLAPGSILLPSKEVKNPLDDELSRLGIPLGLVGNTIADKLSLPAGLDLGPKTREALTKSRGTIKLSADEHYQYQRIAGQTTKSMLTILFDRQDYQNWDMEKQREEAERAIGKAREYARSYIVRMHRGYNPGY